MIDHFRKLSELAGDMESKANWIEHNWSDSVLTSDEKRAYLWLEDKLADLIYDARSKWGGEPFGD